MRYCSRHVICISSTFTSHFRSCFSTKYTARIVRSASGGRFIAAEVDPPVLPADIRGYAVPRRDLVCKIVQLLRQSSSTSSDSFLGLADYLRSLSLSITPSESSEILKCINCPQKALAFFRFCSSGIPNFRHDAFSYNRLLLILSKSSSADNLDLIRSTVDDMDNSGVRGNISTVNILIGVFGGSDLDRCLALIKKWDLRFTCYTYKCLLQAYLRSHNSAKAYEAFANMQRKGYKLDIFAYNMLLNALDKDEKVSEALKVFDDMKRNHCQLDEYTYTIMIRMTGKIGEADKSLKLFEEMEAKGITLNAIAYNTLIEALIRSHLIDESLSIFSKMVNNNCKPNEFTYSVILHALASKGKLRKLDEVVEISKQFMNKSTYAYLVRTLGKMGHASEAHRVFRSMWSIEGRGDRDAYMSMLASLCHEDKMKEALDFLHRIHERGVAADTIMYNVVFSALGRLKRVSELRDLYVRMKREGPSPDVFTFNILISSFGRAGMVEETLKIFEELEDGECKPDIISYNSLINCLGKNGCVDDAHMRFREMRERGLDPDVVTYSTLIECFGNSGKVGMACCLFDEMIGKGCLPNIVTYNILLDCLEKCGRIVQAVDLYAKLKRQGLTPDSVTHAVLRRMQSGSRKKVRNHRKNMATGWVVSPLG